MEIIQLIEEQPGLTREEIARAIGINKDTVSKHLHAIERGNGITMHNGGDYLYIEHHNLIKKKTGSHSPYQYTIIK